VQSDPDGFTRRHFLQWTSAGLAASTAKSLLPSAFAQQEATTAGERAAPAHPIVLSSPELEVTLDAASGLRYHYRLSNVTALLPG
jgi:hypothetical protein